MGILRSPGWGEEAWTEDVLWERGCATGDASKGTEPCHRRPEEDDMRQRVLELIKGDYQFLPEDVKTATSWAEVYNLAYAQFNDHKSACEAMAPAKLMFGPERWERINVSSEFRHSVMCLSRWYDDLVQGACDSQGDLYFRDIAVYRRNDKYFNLGPNNLLFDVLPGQEETPNTVPAREVAMLSALVNEPTAELMRSALGRSRRNWRELFVQVSVRRLLKLDSNTCIAPWLCSPEFALTSYDEEEGNTSLQRQHTGEVLERLVQPVTNSESLTPGDTIHLLRSAANDLSGVMVSQTPGIARRVLQYHADILSLRRVGALTEEERFVEIEEELRQQAGTQRDLAGWRAHMMERALAEIRRVVFPGVTDAEIEDGSAKATLLYLSDSDAWTDGPGRSELQPAANLVFFHRDMAVLVTAHSPHDN